MKYRYSFWLILIAVNIYLFWGSSPKDSIEVQVSADSKVQPDPVEESVEKNVESESPRKKGFMPNTFVGRIDLQIKELLFCYQTQSCDFPQEDSRAYDLAVGQDLKDKLLQLEAYLIKNPESYSEQVTDIVERTLAVPDGHVKEAALLIQVNQGPDPQILQAVLDHVIDYHDGQLMPLAMAELSKYTDEGTLDQIHQRILQSLLRGSHNSRYGLAKNIEKVLSQDRLADYEAVMRQMPPSDLRDMLKHKIDEFRRSRAGA